MVTFDLRFFSERSQPTSSNSRINPPRSGDIRNLHWPISSRSRDRMESGLDCLSSKGLARSHSLRFPFLVFEQGVNLFSVRHGRNGSSPCHSYSS